MNHAYFPTIFKIGPTAEQAVEKQEAQTAVVLTETDWQQLLANAETRHYQLDEVIIRKGEQPEALYLINQGEVRVEQQADLVLAYHGAGAVFGEMSFLMGKAATASVIAASAVEVSVIASAQVRQHLESDPGLAARFYQTLAVTLAHRLHKASLLLTQS